MGGDCRAYYFFDPCLSKPFMLLIKTQENKKSMIIVYKRLFLYFALCLAFLTSSAGAAEVILSPIVVTATRAPAPASHNAANVSLLTAEEIQRLPARNVAQALSYLPGVFIDHNGGLGSQATAGIYGSEARHVAVFIDGVPLNMLANPMTDLSKIPLDRVARIEVFKGTASSAWGSALGGVINIITRSPASDKPFSGRAALTCGDFQTFAAEVGLEGRLGPTGYLISISQTQSNGFDEHRDYSQDSAYLKLIRRISPRSEITFAASLDQSDKKDPLLHRPGRWESASLDRNYQSLNLETRISPRLDFSLNLRNHVLDSFVDFNFDALPRQNYFTYVEQTQGVSAKVHYHSPAVSGRSHSFVMGIDGDWGNYNFSPLGRDIAARNQDLWLSETLDLGPWSLYFGGRWDDNQDFGSQFSPSAGVVYRLDQVPARIRFQWAKGFSAPPLSFLYDPWAGNPDLGPETGATWQLGGEADLGKRLHLGLNLFRADLEDMIYYDPLLGQVVNLDEVRRTGLELNLSLDLGAGWALSWGGLWVEVENVRTNQDVADIPVRTYDLGLRHNSGDLTQSLNGRWADYNSSQADTKDKRFILDYLLHYKLSGGFTLQAAVHNLTNETEYHWWFLPHPGRWVEAGLSCSF